MSIGMDSSTSLCSGSVTLDELEDHKELHVLDVDRCSEPFERYCSTNCSQWHVPNNTRKTPNSKGFNCCKACKQLLLDVHQLEKVTEKCSESDAKKLNELSKFDCEISGKQHEDLVQLVSLADKYKNLWLKVTEF